jgi:hypothetical protein
MSRAARPASNSKRPMIDAKQQQFEHAGQTLQIRRRFFLLTVSATSNSSAGFFERFSIVGF